MNTRSAYGEGKRLSELLCALYEKQYGIDCKIARCFAFIGPYLPVDSNFAVGNFLSDGILGGPIVVKGDGTTYRSYLYAADLVLWLWTILFTGLTCRPYNVGSEDEITIAELARMIGNGFTPAREIVVKQQPVEGRFPEWYVPSTYRARKELMLKQIISLEDSILRTKIFIKKSNDRK